MKTYIAILSIVAMMILVEGGKKHVQSTDSYKFFPAPEIHTHNPLKYYINMFTGALTLEDVDFLTSEFEFRRFYNPMTLAASYTPAQAERWKNPMGYGWKHRFNIYIEEIQQINSPGDTVKACMFHMSKSPILYKMLPNGQYVPKRGRHAILKKIGNTHALYSTYGSIYYFGVSGQIDSFVDYEGNKTTFVYSGNYQSQIIGPNSNTVYFGYNSDSLLTSLMVIQAVDTTRFEYRYKQITCTFGKNTIEIPGMFHLTQVLRRYTTNNGDSIISLCKYYYEDNTMRLIAEIKPHDAHTQSDSVWERNYKSGDRLYIWYDKAGAVIHYEMIEGDGDTLLTNDNLTYCAYIRYYRNPSFVGWMDSTKTYLYRQKPGAVVVHSPYDTLFIPKPPDAEAAIIKRDYHGDVLGRKIIVEASVPNEPVLQTKYFKDDGLNDTLVILPDNDTVRYIYETYTINGGTELSEKPSKIIHSKGDTILHYYHTPDTNFPSFFILDSTKGEPFDYR